MSLMNEINPWKNDEDSPPKAGGLGEMYWRRHPSSDVNASLR